MRHVLDTAIISLVASLLGLLLCALGVVWLDKGVVDRLLWATPLAALVLLVCAALAGAPISWRLAGFVVCVVYAFLLLRSVPEVNFGDVKTHPWFDYISRAGSLTLPTGVLAAMFTEEWTAVAFVGIAACGFMLRLSLIDLEGRVKGQQDRQRQRAATVAEAAVTSSRRQREQAATVAAAQDVEHERKLDQLRKVHAQAAEAAAASSRQNHRALSQQLRQVTRERDDNAAELKTWTLRNAADSIARLDEQEAVKQRRTILQSLASKEKGTWVDLSTLEKETGLRRGVIVQYLRGLENRDQVKLDWPSESGAWTEKALITKEGLLAMDQSSGGDHFHQYNLDGSSGVIATGNASVIQANARRIDRVAQELASSAPAPNCDERAVQEAIRELLTRLLTLAASPCVPADRERARELAQQLEDAAASPAALRQSKLKAILDDVGSFVLYAKSIVQPISEAAKAVHDLFW